MITIGDFDDEFNSLKAIYPHASYEYDGSQSFTSRTTAHFAASGSRDKYGVYVIRQKSSGEIRYIGKGGTLNASGQFRGQDVPGRLKNVKGNDIPADRWFADLLAENGPLSIEYLLLQATPASPALVESLLLQAYLNTHCRLPQKNNAF